MWLIVVLGKCRVQQPASKKIEITGFLEQLIMSEPEEPQRRDLPSDPNAEYYLHNCFVCQEEAKPGQVREHTP